MALINTEEGAKRLARVILSDIELYSRERPQAGVSLAAQIEEGRRLFKSRVTNVVLPLFDVVLTDRQAASAITSVPMETPSVSVAASTGDRSLEDQLTPGPTHVVQILGDQPMPRRLVTAPARADQATPRPRIAVPVVADRPAPVSMAPPRKFAPALPLRSVASEKFDEPTPVPVAERNLEPRKTAPSTPGPEQRSPGARVPAGPFPSMPDVRVAYGRSPAPFAGEASEAPVPILTSPISIPRLLALVAMAIAAIALLCRYIG